MVQIKVFVKRAGSRSVLRVYMGQAMRQFRDWHVAGKQSPIAACLGKSMIKSLPDEMPR
jgi:hypothetical protein